MIEHDKQSARSPEQSAPVEPENFQAAAGRRRFLKGLGIGLPAVMTLRSGALMAATSSQCLANRTSANSPVPPTTPAFKIPDSWVRDDQAYKLYEYNSNRVVRINTTSGTPCYNPSTGDSVTTDCDKYITQVGTDSYYPLCYVNNDGSLVICEPNNPSGTAQLPATASCALNSFGFTKIPNP